MLRLTHRSIFGSSYLEFVLGGILPTELSRMVASGLAPITACGFLTQLSQAVVDDVERHINGVGRVRVVARKDGNELDPVAFVAANVMANLYHLGGIIVTPEMQGKGLGEKLLRDELQLHKSEVLGFHTQSEHMLRLGRRLAGYDHSLALLNADYIGSGTVSEQVVDGEKMLVQPARYGQSSLYGDLAQFAQMGRQIPGLNTTNGDAIVYIGKVK